MDRRGETARLGERSVAALLEERGFVVLATNVQVGRLELDVVARRKHLVVVCEVRTRTSTLFGDPVETIGAAKIANVRRAAATWLRARPDLRRATLRFDAAGVTLHPDGRVEIEYFEDAF
ncbi:MAG: YraN family protein [Myxococcales bacterium]|nr:YraN family protein [Myxococcales bacterium]